jgi:hypothetical protein
VLTGCKTSPIDAEIVDHAFVTYLNAFLGDVEGWESRRPSPGFPRERLRGNAPTEPLVVPVAALAEQLMHRIRTALAVGDAAAADSLIAELVDHRLRFQAAVVRPRERARPESPARLQGLVDLLFDFYAWSANGLAGLPTDLEETRRLNSVLRGWFSRVTLTKMGSEIELAPVFVGEDGADAGRRVTLHIPSWTIATRSLGRQRRRRDPWTKEEIVHALKQWDREHGRAPNSIEWAAATAEYPHATSVFQHFGRWTTALRAANLNPTPSVHRGPRTDDEILDEINAWARKAGRVPRIDEWRLAADDHPCYETVHKRFGTWEAALRAARSRHPATAA